MNRRAEERNKLEKFLSCTVCPAQHRAFKLSGCCREKAVCETEVKTVLEGSSQESSLKVQGLLSVS